MQKDLNVCDLLEVYGMLLTERQQESLRLYYEEDLSLAEIAEHQKISRQGVMEAVRAGSRQLYHYEEHLGLLKKKEEMAGYVEQMEALEESNEELMQIVQKLKECIHGI